MAPPIELQLDTLTDVIAEVCAFVKNRAAPLSAAAQRMNEVSLMSDVPPMAEMAPPYASASQLSNMTLYHMLRRSMSTYSDLKHPRLRGDSAAIAI